jgi:hypothetical protein
MTKITVDKALIEQALDALTGADAFRVGMATTLIREALREAQQASQPTDMRTMELAESVGLIGPESRTHDLHGAIQRFHDVIAAEASIKAAKAFAQTLEQEPPGEPVAWMPKTWPERYVSGVEAVTCYLRPTTGWVPLYTRPAVPLTDEQKHSMVKECGLDWQRGYMPLFDGDPTNRYAVLIEAVEAAHKIGNQP